MGNFIWDSFKKRDRAPVGPPPERPKYTHENSGIIRLANGDAMGGPVPTRVPTGDPRLRIWEVSFYNPVNDTWPRSRVISGESMEQMLQALRGLAEPHWLLGCISFKTSGQLRFAWKPDEGWTDSADLPTDVPQWPFKDVAVGEYFATGGIVAPKHTYEKVDESHGRWLGGTGDKLTVFSPYDHAATGGEWGPDIPDY